MSEAIQKRRRADRFKDWLASIAVALGLALLLAALLEVCLFAIGLAVSDLDWHRGWVEKRLRKGLEGLQFVPVLGSLSEALFDPQRGWLPGRGAWRDILVLAGMLVGPCLVPAARIGPALIARFDGEALRPLPPSDHGLRWAGPLGVVQQRAWTELQAWCDTDMGDGHSPLWRPWAH